MNIRSAEPEDVLEAVELLLLTMGQFGTAVFGLGKPDLARQVIAHSYLHPSNRFSYQLANLAVAEDGHIAGLLLSFPGRRQTALSLGLMRQLLRVFSFPQLLRFLWGVLPMPRSVETKNDEYYIAHLAVNPLDQRQGIGRELLLYAEAQARQHGLKRCSLIVELGNDPARRLYISQGYQVVETVPPGMNA
jgi:ribosomal protein S18 acetylase RimI-like enzyme